jgi:ribonuclease HII
LKRTPNGPTWEAVFALGGSASEAVVGIDEVGRGAWAGPVTSAAVLLPYGLQIWGLADSKLLSPAKRNHLDAVIRAQASAIGLGWVSADEVDANGLSWAVRQSGLRALEALGRIPDRLILDGRVNFLRETHPSMAIIGADALVTPVAAASVVAKVARDNYMVELNRLHRGYGFDSHKGYGTSEHRRALEALGVSPVHRRSYRPIKALIRVDD